jgi:hypothetical protein
MLAQIFRRLLRIAFEMTRGSELPQAEASPQRLFREMALLAYPPGVRTACRDFEAALRSGLQAVERVEPPSSPDWQQRLREQEMEAFLADLTALGQAAGRLKLGDGTLSARGRLTASTLLEKLRELGAAAAATGDTP